MWTHVDNEHCAALTNALKKGGLSKYQGCKYNILLFESASCVSYLVSETEKTLSRCRVMWKVCGPKAWSTNQTVREYQGPTCGQK